MHFYSHSFDMLHIPVSQIYVDPRVYVCQLVILISYILDSGVATNMLRA